MGLGKGCDACAVVHASTERCLEGEFVRLGSRVRLGELACKVVCTADMRRSLGYRADRAKGLRILCTRE